ncbi:hypothetical protein GKE82_20600 [Conexibacter sp. W3-3-2]|uniref:Uncharacterized protein n=1 Tax=Paraconexibacter algicola TaxID=2133960 RepID=A0A2T4UM98_9ACTN|nr:MULTISPECIES: hypothetical protein [Solirubrobacterales]MTD46623.1 hypothetical protein [Conexibacter sp. W3-3-2]PTL60344.1 hypothetical protein C7Y72_12200 [Paraconexibacter algicola]
MSIQLVVIDRAQLLSHALGRVLRDCPDITLAGSWRSVAEARAGLTYRPDAVVLIGADLLDQELPAALEGRTVIAWVSEHGPAPAARTVSAVAHKRDGPGAVPCAVARAVGRRRPW